MAGANLFEGYGVKAVGRPTSKVCVFISHNSKDKTFARTIAAALMAMGVDIYFDEQDGVLRAAVAQNDEQKIVACIENGLNHCTHLLGLISKVTFKSWWVPYEIGGANGRSRKCAHLVAKDVTQLPSYVKIAALLLDQIDLRRWLEPALGISRSILEHRVTGSVQIELEQYVAKIRTERGIDFTNMD